MTQGAQETKVIREIRDVIPEDLGLLAEAYVAGFTAGEWQGEEHTLEEAKLRIAKYLLDPLYTVRLIETNHEFVGFAITRKVPVGEIVENLVDELRDVSQVNLSDEEISHLRQQILGILGVSHLSELEPGLLAGVFQDIVIDEKHRGSRAYLELMLNMTSTLIKDAQVKMIIVYTKETIEPVVKTLQKFGGTKILDNGQVVVFSGLADTARANFAKFASQSPN